MVLRAKYALPKMTLRRKVLMVPLQMNFIYLSIQYICLVSGCFENSHKILHKKRKARKQSHPHSLNDN